MQKVFDIVKKLLAIAIFLAMLCLFVWIIVSDITYSPYELAWTWKSQGLEVILEVGTISISGLSTLYALKRLL